MSNIIVQTSFGSYVNAAQSAVQHAPTQESVWAAAEYLDLVEAKEVATSGKLVRACKEHIQCFVVANLKDDSLISLWERAGCLFRAYKRALKAAERSAYEHAALAA